MKVRGTVVQGAWWAVRPVLCAASLSLLPLGCTSQHEAPQVSDTATNWLFSCAQPSDCSGEASCIAGVCTLACSSAAAACDALHDDARCLLGPAAPHCDLPCTADATCQAFSASHTCQGGSCRQSSVPAASDLSGAELTEGTSFSFEFQPEQTILLSELDRQASVPSVRWLGDGWSVVWTSSEATVDSGGLPTLAPMLYSARVYTHGHVERSAAEFAQAGFPESTVKGNGQRVALIVGRSATLASSSCRLGIVDTATMTQVSSLLFACGGDFAVAPVAGSEEWLVAWSLGQDGPGGEVSDLLLARYDPASNAFVAGPWSVVPQTAHDSISLGVVGEDAWLAWPSAGQAHYARVPGAAAPGFAGISAPVQTLDFASTEDSSYGFVELAGGALMLGADGSDVFSVRVADQQAAPTALAPTLVGDRPLGIARVSDELFAVCYAEGPNPASGNRVMLLTADGSGQRVGEPVSVADGIENVGGCDLAWSGSQLLVAWWDIAFDRPRATREHSTVNARILPLP